MADRKVTESPGAAKSLQIPSFLAKMKGRLGALGGLLPASRTGAVSIGHERVADSSKGA